MTVDKNLSMINNSDSRFSQLRGQTQILPAITLPSQVKPKTRHDIHEKNNQDLKREHDAIDNPKPDKETPADLNEIQLNIAKASQNRAFKVLTKITNNPQILAWTVNGELSFLGKPIPNSNFDALFKSAFIPNSNTNIIGIDKFMKGLRLIHVNSAELSATSFKRVYIPTSLQSHSLSKTVHRSPTELQESDALSFPSISTARLKHQARHMKTQSDKGLSTKAISHYYVGSPLVKRAKILYVY